MKKFFELCCDTTAIATLLAVIAGYLPYIAAATTALYYFTKWYYLVQDRRAGRKHQDD